MKEKLNSRKRRITLTDLFLTYPYKKRDPKRIGLGGSDHFPKSEIVNDHNLSVDRKQFLKIAEKLFEERFVSLLKGEEVQLPLRSGVLVLNKYRPKKPSINWPETNRLYGEHNKNTKTDKKFIYHKNYHTQGYKPLVKWDKSSCAMVNNHIFKFSLIRGRQREMARFFIENPNMISNLNDN